MQINKIRLNGGVDVDLPIIGATLSDTYLLKGADGLGPVDQNTVFLNGVYQGKKPSDRQIVLRVGLNANYGLNQTPEQLRSTLYGLLTLRPKKMLQVQFMYGNVVVGWTEGKIDKLEPVLFSKETEVQLTISCTDAYLYAPFATMPNIATTSQFTIPYEGTAEAGFRMEIEFTASIPDFAIYDQNNPDTTMEIETPFVPGDKLIIDTRKGVRSILVDGGLDITNKIGALSQVSEWLELYPGDNEFAVNQSAFEWVSFEYVAKYSGV